MKRPIFLYSFLYSLIGIIYFTLYISVGGFVSYFSFLIFLFIICFLLGIVHFFPNHCRYLLSKILGISWFSLAAIWFLSIGALIGYYTSAHERIGVYLYPFYLSVVLLFVIGFILFLTSISFIAKTPFWLMTIKRKTLPALGVFLIIIVIYGGVIQYSLLMREIKSVNKMKEIRIKNSEDIKLFFNWLKEKENTEK